MTNTKIMRFALGTLLRTWMANCFRIARTTPAQGRAQRPHKAVQAGLLIFEKKRTSQKTLDLTLYLDLGHGHGLCSEYKLATFCEILQYVTHGYIWTARARQLWQYIAIHADRGDIWRYMASSDATWRPHISNKTQGHMAIHIEVLSILHHTMRCGGTRITAPLMIYGKGCQHNVMAKSGDAYVASRAAINV